MDWKEQALACGFTDAAVLDVTTLKPMKMVRDACETDRCGAYGKNWSCPPACGTLEACTRRIQQYQKGYLLLTVGQLRKVIDTKGYQETLDRHTKALHAFADWMLQRHKDVLVLGSGGCTRCGTCAYPEPCRFPDQAVSAMEAYGIFVTQVCKDNKVSYYNGPKTVTYIACVLFREQEA